MCRVCASFFLAPPRVTCHLAPGVGRGLGARAWPWAGARGVWRVTLDNKTTEILEAPEPLALGSVQAFYKCKQEGIKSYRMAYNNRVDAHFDGLASSAHGVVPPPPPAAPAEALAHELAGRHVESISAFVRAEDASRFRH